MIRVVVIGIFRQGRRILVTEGFDSVKKERFARPPGGGIEMGETSAEALHREIREELGQEITQLRQVGVLENRFTYRGQPGHEIVFVYESEFVDAELYDREEISWTEPGRTRVSLWRSLDSFGADCQLVPEGLEAMLQAL